MAMGDTLLSSLANTVLVASILCILFCRFVEIAQALLPLLAALMALGAFFSLCDFDCSENSDSEESDRRRHRGQTKQECCRPSFLFLTLFVMSIFCVVDEFIHPYFVVPDQAFRYKTALVTGANSGVGLELSRAVAEGGGRVYLACRSIHKCQNAADDINAGLQPTNPGRAIVASAPLDISNLSSVTSFASTFRDKDMGRVPLNYLVNNAGFGIKAGQKLNADRLETGWGSMHLGHLLLTELLHKSQPSEIAASRDADLAGDNGFTEILANREKISGTGMVLSMDLDAVRLVQRKDNELSKNNGNKAKRRQKRFFPGSNSPEQAPKDVKSRKAHCRVIFVSSATHHLCEHFECFPKGYFGEASQGTLLQRHQHSDKLAYPRAKALNLLTAAELPRHHPEWTSLSVDLGFVHTSIASYMDYLGLFMRSPAVGVRPILYGMLAKVAHLDGKQAEPQARGRGIYNGHVVHTMYTSAPVLKWRNPMIDRVFALGDLPLVGPFYGVPRRTPYNSDEERFGYTDEEIDALKRDVWKASMLEIRQRAGNQEATVEAYPFQL